MRKLWGSLFMVIWKVVSLVMIFLRFSLEINIDFYYFPTFLYIISLLIHIMLCFLLSHVFNQIIIN